MFIEAYKKYIINITNFFKLNDTYNFKIVLINSKLLTIKYMSFLTKYYYRNELIWVDGFLLDFLQKKSIDKWLRKFVIYTGFIFSERLVFDYVVRLYLDNIIWPLHYISVFEPSSIIEMLSITIFLYFSFFSLFSLLIIFIF